MLVRSRFAALRVSPSGAAQRGGAARRAAPHARRAATPPDRARAAPAALPPVFADPTWLAFVLQSRAA